MMPPPSTGNPEQDRINMEDFRRQEENMRRFYDNFAGVGTLNPVQVAEDNRAMQTVGIGSIGMMQAGQMGPLSGLGQYLNQELAQENQGEVNEFIGEVGDMANQRFGVDLGSVGQRPMFDVGRPVQAYADGGAAFPDVTGPGGGPPDGKVTQADILKLRGVELKQYGGPIGMAQGGDIFEAVTGIPFSSLNNLPPAQREIALQKFEQYQLAQETERAMQQAQALQKNVEGRGAQLEGMQEQMRFLDRGVQDLQSFQEGGMAMPMPPQAPPMPMPAPEQPPMPMEDQLDPNVVQSALAQAAGGIGDLDQAQNYEQVMNTMRGDQATVEERRQELAGVVGPGDAGQTPESVLTLVQPVMMLANVDQGIGQLAQQEMTQPMEGPMAGGIMSTVPEPPMMEAGGDAPVNFNKGGEVRPIQYLEPGGVAGDKPFASLKGQPISPFIQQAMAVRQPLLSDPASLERQKDLTKAQILFDLAQTGLAFAAPMEGERPGLSPAERLAMAARSTRLPEKIGARAQALGDKEAAQEAQDKAIMASAITSAETQLSAKEAADRTLALQALKGEQDLTLAEKKSALEKSEKQFQSRLDTKKSITVNRELFKEKEDLEKVKSAYALRLENFKSKTDKEKINLKAELDAERDRLNAMDTAYRQKKSEQHNRAMLLLKTDLEKELIALRGDETMEAVNARIKAQENLANINSQLRVKELGVKNNFEIGLIDKKHTQALEINRTNNALKERLASARNKIAENELKLKGDKFKLDQERLELDQTVAAEKAQIQRETLDLKLEEFELEKQASKLLDIPGIEGAYVGWLNSNLDLASEYADGTTNSGQDNTIELVISNFTSPRSVYDEQTGRYVEKAGGKLSDEWTNAIKLRAEKFGANKSLPSTAREEVNVKLPKLEFKSDGTVNYDAFKGGNNFIINGVDLAKSTGFRAGIDRGLNSLFGQIKDLTGLGSGYSGLRGKEVSVATEQLNRLATSVISSSRDLVNGKVFALDLTLLQQDVDKFRPAAGNTDVRARDSLKATRDKVALGYNNLISKLNNPDSYTESQVTVARENKEKVEALLGELTAAIASFERGIDGSDVGQAEAQTFQQSNEPVYLQQRNNQEEEVFP